MKFEPVSAPLRLGILSLLGVLLMCVAAHRAPAAEHPPKWHWASIHGHRIYYAVRGSGSALLFLHGGGASGEHSFVRQLDVFSEHHHIVAPDQVGQGRTPDVPGPLSYTAMMEDTAALLQMLKLKQVDVVGFSDGGILALMLAVRHPELLRRVVISGVNIAPEGLKPEDLEELRASQIPKPKTIDEKLAHLWLTSPTETELSLALLGDRGRAHVSCQRERRRRRPHWLPHCTHRARLTSNEVESGIQDGRERNGGNQSGDATGYVIGIPSNCGRTDHLPRGLVNGEDRGRAYTSEPVWCVGKGHGHRHFQCDQRDPGALLKRHRLVAYGLRLSAISASPVITAAAEPLRQLGYGQVQLAAGPLQRQARENHLLVLALDEKALLRPYRIRAGLAAPGHDFG